jgi:hypothetical protein
VQISVPDTDEMSFFIPQDAETLRTSPLASIRVLADFGGIFMTMGPQKSDPTGVPQLPPGFENFQPALEKLVKVMDTPEAEARFVANAEEMAKAMGPEIEAVMKKIKAAREVGEKDQGEVKSSSG